MLFACSVDAEYTTLAAQPRIMTDDTTTAYNTLECDTRRCSTIQCHVTWRTCKSVPPESNTAQCQAVQLGCIKVNKSCALYIHAAHDTATKPHLGRWFLCLQIIDDHAAAFSAKHNSGGTTWLKFTCCQIHHLEHNNIKQPLGPDSAYGNM